MRRLITLCLALTLAVGFVGCTPKAEVKEETTTTTTTPGGESTTTETTTIEQTGENPPPAEAPAP